MNLLKYIVYGLLLGCIIWFTPTLAEECKPGYSLSNALGDARGGDVSESDLPYYLSGAAVRENVDAGTATKQATTFMQKLISALVDIVAAIAVIFVMINGGKLLLSFGSTDDLGKAKKGFIGVLLGLLLIIFAYIIVKSVIGLLYSGADTGENTRQKCTPTTEQPANKPAKVNNNAAEAEPEEAPTAVAQQCEPLPVSIPEKCTTGNRTTGQNSTSSCDESVLLPKLTPVCTELNLSCSQPDDTNKSNIKAIQNKVLSFYSAEDNKIGCANVDGIYGQCTVDAIKHAFTKKCVTPNGTIEDREPDAKVVPTSSTGPSTAANESVETFTPRIARSKNRSYTEVSPGVFVDDTENYTFQGTLDDQNQILNGVVKFKNLTRSNGIVISEGTTTIKNGNRVSSTGLQSDGSSLSIEYTDDEITKVVEIDSNNVIRLCQINGQPASTNLCES